jgi:hypothetical protein
MSSVIASPESQPLSVPDTYGFAFLKTGYHPILPEFKADLAEHGVRTIHIAPVMLHSDAVDWIYRDSTHEHFYPSMKCHLTKTAVLAMVLESMPDAPEPQVVLNSLKKGANGYPNLRERYQKCADVVCDEDFKDWCDQKFDDDKQDELTITLTQRNVFHAADDQPDAMKTLAVIRDTSPEFYQRNITTRVRKLARLVDHLITFSYDGNEPNGDRWTQIA